MYVLSAIMSPCNEMNFISHHVHVSTFQLSTCFSLRFLLSTFCISTKRLVLCCAVIVGFVNRMLLCALRNSLKVVNF